MASANSALVQMQKLANQTQVKLQEMVNNANSSQMAYNADEAQKSRDWQTWMSQNAHQMEVADLKKAGLNPVLSSGGSGAQSYTTSSASTQNESGANALASVQSSQLGAIGSMESSRITAAAQRAAAAQAAAATRAAAAAAAGAQMYAADKAYSSAKIQSEASKAVATINSEANKWISQNKQASSWSAFADKYLAKTGLKGPSVSVVKSAYKSLAEPIVNLVTNPGKYFKNVKKSGEFVLNTLGINAANKALAKAGLDQNASNRKLLIQGYVFKSDSSRTTLMNKIINSRFSKGSKSTTRSTR